MKLNLILKYIIYLVSDNKRRYYPANWFLTFKVWHCCLLQGTDPWQFEGWFVSHRGWNRKTTRLNMYYCSFSESALITSEWTTDSQALKVLLETRIHINYCRHRYISTLLTSFSSTCLLNNSGKRLLSLWCKIKSDWISLVLWECGPRKELIPVSVLVHHFRRSKFADLLSQGS